MPSSSKDLTQMLRQWSQGDQHALAELMPVVYDELHRIAEHYLRSRRSPHTLQATALVHEAYLRLVGRQYGAGQNRAHFFGIAANIMRSILVGYARRHYTAKRGGGQYQLSLEEAADLPAEPAVDMVGLDDALTTLAAIDPRQTRIVELRFFGGLTMEEIAEVLGVSVITIKREWSLARTWLYREIKK